MLLILGIVFMTISCKKEDVQNLKTSKNPSTSTLKCGSDDVNDYYKRFKWKSISEMVKNIHWIQQSCMRIEWFKYKIYTDPLSIQQTDAANLILISHAHGDHFSPSDIDKLTGPNTVIIAPEDCNYSG